MNRRILTLLVALVPIIAFAALTGLATVPFVALGPGPTFNTLGEVDGKQVVDIQGEGVQIYPTDGNLNMTTVAQRDQLTMGLALALWISGREQLVPRDILISPEKSPEEVERENTEDFEMSEATAEYAALDYLDYEPALTVEVVNDDGPSAGKLQAGDAIDKVDGTPITGSEQFQSLLKQTKPGQVIVVDYRRKDAEPGSAPITLGDNPDRDYGFLGVAVVDAPWAPFEITFNLANIGGPSAGLMFSLALVDKLTPGEMTGGQFVAGTGSILADGQVEPIGGITHKMLAAREAGATVFLVPADNCDEARSAGDGLELVKVETLAQTVDALEKLSAGGEPARC